MGQSVWTGVGLEVQQAVQATHIHTYDGAAQLEVGIPHSACFLALSFELQTRNCVPLTVW